MRLGVAAADFPLFAASSASRRVSTQDVFDETDDIDIPVLLAASLTLTLTQTQTGVRAHTALELGIEPVLIE